MIFRLIQRIRNDLDQIHIPDPVAQELQRILERIERLEADKAPATPTEELRKEED
jgi:uncharacterized protein (UPF0335 family)